MPLLSELAIGQCIEELRAACRRPIDQSALDALVALLRPQFEEILDHPEGALRWADHGPQMRSNGRHIGALADFFGYEADVTTVRQGELMRAFNMIAKACRVGAERRSNRPAQTPGSSGQTRQPA